MNKLIFVLLAIVLISASAFRMRDSTDDKIKQLNDKCRDCFPNAINGDFSNSSGDCQSWASQCRSLTDQLRLMTI